MNNNFINFLENYLGYILCVILNVFRHSLGVLFEKKYNQASSKIVFVKFIEQGALVLHRPAFNMAIEKYGRKNVAICTFLSNSNLLKALAVFDDENIITIDDSSWSTFLKDYLKALITIRKRGIDSIIDLEFFSRATAIFCYLSGAKKRAGYHRFLGSETFRGDLFTHKLNYSHHVHVSESSVLLLNALDVDVATLPALDLSPSSFPKDYQFSATQQNIEHIQDKLGAGFSRFQKKIVINPNFNDVLPLRQWEPENYAILVKAIFEVDPETCFVFTGRVDEYNTTNTFIEKYQIKNAINLCGKTNIIDLLSLYGISDLLITSDSGPGHFASITNIKSIILFGPETPALYGPQTNNTHIIYKKTACSPCYNVYNNRMSACKSNICMKTISNSEVLNLSLKLLINS